MTKEELTEDIIRKLGLLSFLINEVAASLKYSSPTANVQIAEDFYKSSLKKYAGRGFLRNLVFAMGIICWEEAIIEYENNWDSRAHELSSESPSFITADGEIYRFWGIHKGNVSFITNTWTTIKAKHYI